MKRRAFVTFLCGAAIGNVGLWSLAARARQPRVAMIHPTIKADEMSTGGDPIYAVIFEEIKRLGS
jgi:hypothetical protein